MKRTKKRQLNDKEMQNDQKLFLKLWLFVLCRREGGLYMWGPLSHNQFMVKHARTEWAVDPVMFLKMCPSWKQNNKR